MLVTPVYMLSVHITYQPCFDLLRLNFPTICNLCGGCGNVLFSVSDQHGIFLLLFFASTVAAEPPSSKPYQGVRVKDPVKELLRRKRGSNNPNSVKTSPPTAVSACPHFHSPPHALSAKTGICGHRKLCMEIHRHQ